jgi:hypothetical protein
MALKMKGRKEEKKEGREGRREGGASDVFPENDLNLVLEQARKYTSKKSYLKSNVK